MTRPNSNRPALLTGPSGCGAVCTNAPNRVFLKRRARRMFALAASSSVLIGCATRSTGGRDFPPVPGIAGAQALRLGDSVRAILSRAMADSAFPGAYAAVGTADGVIVEYGVGRLDVDDDSRPSATTIWDLASLTKVIGTTSAMIQLVGSGRVALDSPVVRYLPAWKAPGAERITVRHLLSHSSGMPAWRALYKEAATAEEAEQQLFATSPDTLPGVRYVYSDLGFILLGKLVERVSGERLALYDSAHVFSPLGMPDTRYLPPVALLPRIAPTEQDPWRQKMFGGKCTTRTPSVSGASPDTRGCFRPATIWLALPVCICITERWMAFGYWIRQWLRCLRECRIRPSHAGRLDGRRRLWATRRAVGCRLSRSATPGSPAPRCGWIRGRAFLCFC